MPRAAAKSKPAKPPRKGGVKARAKAPPPKPEPAPPIVFAGALEMLAAPATERPRMMARRGSPYRPEMCEVAEEHLSAGLTLAGLAGLFGVSPRTVDNWVRSYEEFAEACAIGRCRHVANLEIQVANAARGVWDPSKSQITALLASLNNLAPSYWRQRKPADDQPDPLDAAAKGQDDRTLRIEFVRPAMAA